MSIGPWNTGTGGAAVCEDMPRKSIDIKLSEYPVQQKREHCALFLPSGEDGSGRARGVSQRADSLRVSQLYSGPLESLLASISAIFKVLLSLFFMAYFS